MTACTTSHSPPPPSALRPFEPMYDALPPRLAPQLTSPTEEVTSFHLELPSVASSDSNSSNDKSMDNNDDDDSSSASSDDLSVIKKKLRGRKVTKLAVKTKPPTKKQNNKGRRKKVGTKTGARKACHGRATTKTKQGGHGAANNKARSNSPVGFVVNTTTMKPDSDNDDEFDLEKLVDECGMHF